MTMSTIKYKFICSQYYIIDQLVQQGTSQLCFSFQSGCCINQFVCKNNFNAFQLVRISYKHISDSELFYHRYSNEKNKNCISENDTKTSLLRFHNK